MRAGAQTLTLLGAPRTYPILQSLADGAKGQRELRRDAGFPAQTTLRGQLRSLETSGAVVRSNGDSRLRAFEYNLTAKGRDLLTVAEGLRAWLADGPGGPLELGGNRARLAIKGLVDGWTATVLTNLAPGPLSLTELDRRITTVSYPAIERCLDSMLLAEQLEVGARGRRGTPYEATDWVRLGLGPLVLAARWENRFHPEGAPAVGRADFEGGFALLAPLLEIPTRLSGTCQLAVRAPDGKRKHRALAAIEIGAGAATLGTVSNEQKPDARASAARDTWFSVVIDAKTHGLRLSGDHQLARSLLDAVHERLFGFGSDGSDAAAEPSAQG